MSDDRCVVVEVDLALNDVYSPFRWSRANAARWIASIVLCLIFYDLYRNSRATILSSPTGDSIRAIIVILVVFIFSALLLFPYLRARAMFRKSPALTKMRRYTFQNTGIVIRSEDANTDCKWSLFQRVIETPRVFIFMLTSSTAAYVPKRCFSSSNDVVRVRELVRQNMSGRCRLRRD